MIAVVIPAYDEADRLRTLLPRLPACLFGVAVQVIVVSDGSTDGTDAITLDHGAALVRLPQHRGKGAALRAGFARALELGPSQLVTMDADGQHDPADLERLVQPVMAGECTVAAGSRFLSDPSRGPAPLNHYQSELEQLFEAAIHGLSVMEVPVRAAYPAGCSKMGARFGRLAGRVWVISQYVATIARKTRELRRAYPVARPPVGASVWSGTGRENA